MFIHYIPQVPQVCKLELIYLTIYKHLAIAKPFLIPLNVALQNNFHCTVFSSFVRILVSSATAGCNAKNRWRSRGRGTLVAFHRISTSKYFSTFNLIMIELE